MHSLQIRDKMPWTEKFSVVGMPYRIMLKLYHFGEAPGLYQYTSAF